MLGRKIAVWILSFSVLLGGVSFASASSDKAPQKVWSIDLDADSDFVERSSLQEISFKPPSAGFLNDSQIILDFYDREKIGFSASLSKPSYHVLEIDARTGRFGHKLNFRSVDDRSTALPVTDGGFIVLAGGELRKFSSDFSPGRIYPTKIESFDGQPDRWMVDVSPSGQSVVLNYYRPSTGNGQLIWLRSDDFSLK